MSRAVTGVKHRQAAQVAAPGASNTRRNTPAEAQYEGAESNDFRHLPPEAARVLCTRIDALYLAFQGVLKDDVRAVLTSRLDDAKTLGTAVAMDVGGVPFALHQRSRVGWWKLANDDTTVTIEDGDHLAGWGVEVRATAKLLATAGPRAAIALARAVADALLESVNGERLRRGDLCADVVGFDLGNVDPRAWLTPRRAKVKTFGVLAEPFADHHKAEKRTGFQVGRGDLTARIYDKREELAQRDDEKRAIEEARWRAAGWNGEEGVTRVEFQIRGDALAEIDGGRLRDPEEFLNRCAATWGYCTRSWLRLAERGAATRLHRCPADPRWAVVRDATFEEWDGEIPSRVRRRGAARARLAYGVTLSYAAAVGAVSPLPVERARDHVATWSDERCAAYVRDQVAVTFRAAWEPIAADMLDAMGPKKAAALVIEKRNAACARAASTREASQARQTTRAQGITHERAA